MICVPALHPSLARRHLLAGFGATPFLAMPLSGSTTRRIALLVDDPGAPLFWAERLARRVSALSEGRLTLAAQVSEGAIRTLEQLRNGAEVAHFGSWSTWVDLDPGFGPFGGVPFGLSPGEVEAWILHGGGQALWDRFGAEFGIKPLLAGDLGARPGGYFKTPLTGARALEGRVIAASGLAAAILPALGGAPGPDGEGRLDPDAGPVFHRFPVLAPARPLALTLPLGVWEGLAPADQAILSAAGLELADEMCAAGLDPGRDAEAVNTPLEMEVVEGLALDFWRAAGDAIRARSLNGYLFEDYLAYLGEITGWSGIGEGAFVLARARALGMGVL